MSRTACGHACRQCCGRSWPGRNWLVASRPALACSLAICQGLGLALAAGLHPRTSSCLRSCPPGELSSAPRRWACSLPARPSTERDEADLAGPADRARSVRRRRRDRRDVVGGAAAASAASTDGSGRRHPRGRPLIVGLGRRWCSPCSASFCQPVVAGRPGRPHLALVSRRAGARRASTRACASCASSAVTRRSWSSSSSTRCTPRCSSARSRRARRRPSRRCSSAAQMIRDCVSSFPSVTPVGELGDDDRHRPRRALVMGMNWYHRVERRYVEYGSSFEATRTFGLFRALYDTRLQHEHGPPELAGRDGLRAPRRRRRAHRLQRRF